MGRSRCLNLGTVINRFAVSAATVMLAVLLGTNVPVAGQEPTPAKRGGEPQPKEASPAGKPDADPDSKPKPARIRLTDDNIGSLRFLEKTEADPGKSSRRPRSGRSKPTVTEKTTPKETEKSTDTQPDKANTGGKPDEATPDKAAPQPPATSVPPKTPSTDNEPLPFPTQPEELHRETLDDVHPASFQGIVPGQTTLKQLHEQLGQPAAITKRADGSSHNYQIGPFPKVEFRVTKDDDKGEIVSAVVIQLAEPASPTAVAKELGLDAFESVSIPGSMGRLVAEGYPERGVLLVYSSTTPDQPVDLPVVKLVLEDIDPEAFVLRAKYDSKHRYALNLDDLRFARHLQANQPEANWLEAKILADIGQYKSALEAAQRALNGAANEPYYHLTRADLLGQTGDYKQALAETRKVLEMKDISALVQARAEVQLGNLLVASANNYREALQHHQQAIKLALPLIKSRAYEVRRTAKQIVVDAHIEVANDIAWGQWREKETVVPKWISGAERMANSIVDFDGGDISVLVDLDRRKLAALAGLQGELPADDTVARFAKNSDELIEQSHDPLFRKKLQWEFGQGLFDALRIAYGRGHYDEVQTLGKRAVALIHPQVDQRDTDAANYLLGRLHFMVGASYAVGQNQHETAVVWYEKAAPRLEAALGPLPVGERGRQGERFVSMGVSYWQTGNRNEAVRLTERGASLIEQSVNAGIMEQQALTVPFSNLAKMYRKTGNDEQARTLTARVNRLQEKK